MSSKFVISSIELETHIASLKKLVEKFDLENDTDAKDILEVASLMEARKFSQAAKKVRFLDTVVREAIPNEVYDFLMNFRL